MDLKDLQKENLDLKRKLSIAKIWMEREVQIQVDKITKEKISEMSSKTKDVFIGQNESEVITKKVYSFFGEILLLNTPGSVIENIVSAEISYFNLRENPSTDGLGVITSYHKALDTLIEGFITKGFRKYAKKKGQTQLRRNDSLEKSLNSVVNQGYILSVGRLFHIISLIKEGDSLYDYGKCFKEYLEKYSNISDILFDPEFFNNFKSLISSEILGKKRHVGRITFVETRNARNLLIGDFKDINGLIYKFVELGKIDY